ncbi:MAG: fatty acid desaturase [Leptospira sp.]|nr:fatty acid desaturase [Leptospira sp.]
MQPVLTLSAVRNSVSSESLENPTYLGLLYFTRDLFVHALIITGLFLTDAWYFVVPLWFLSGLSISSLFIIGHDAAHGSLFRNKRLAWWVGQISMVPSLHAFNQWVFGHNRIHHGHTVKIEGDFVWRPVSPSDYAKLGFIGKIWHRVSWSRFGAGIYYLVEIWLKGMILFKAQNPEARRDRFLIISFIILSSVTLIFMGGTGFEPGFENDFSWGAGIWLFAKTVVVPFFMFNYVIGFAVYVHHISDTISWKKHKDWTPFHGQVLGTVNYHVPPFFNFFLHNIFIHMPHHVHMKIPFYHLPRALDEIKLVYGNYVIERKSTFSDYLKATTTCKLFDIQKGKWLTYAQARAEEPDKNVQLELQTQV